MPRRCLPMNTAEFFVERLKTWGVKRIFGYPGDGINGVIGALQQRRWHRLHPGRHEEMAAFTAIAYAKFTGELGVCLSTGGPGATHLITGLYDARWTICRCSPYAARLRRRSVAQLSAGAQSRPGVDGRRRICAGGGQSGADSARDRSRDPAGDCAPPAHRDNPSQGRAGASPSKRPSARPDTRAPVLAIRAR